MDGGFLPHLRRDDPKPPHISTVSVSVSLSSCKPLSSKKQCPEPMEFNCPLLNTKPVSAAATDPRRRAGAHARSCTPVNPPPPQTLQAPTSPRFVNPVTVPAPRAAPRNSQVLYIHIYVVPALQLLPLPAITYCTSLAVCTRSRELHHLPNPCLAPDSYSSFLIPQPTNLSPATPQPSHVKSKQIKSNQISQGPLFPPLRPHFRHPPIIT
jgi:hypothetical protein